MASAVAPPASTRPSAQIDRHCTTLVNGSSSCTSAITTSTPGFPISKTSASIEMQCQPSQWNDAWRRASAQRPPRPGPRASSSSLRPPDTMLSGSRRRFGLVPNAADDQGAARGLQLGGLGGERDNVLLLLLFHVVGVRGVAGKGVELVSAGKAPRDLRRRGSSRRRETSARASTEITLPPPSEPAARIRYCGVDDTPWA